MRRLLIKYNDLKLGRKLTLIFVLISMATVLGLQLVSYQANKKNLTQKIDQVMIGNLTQMAERTNLNFQVYTNLLYQIYIDEEIIENVNILMDDTTQQKAVAYNKVNSRLKQYFGNANGIRCLSVIGADGSSVIYDFSTDSAIDNIWRSFANKSRIPPCQDVANEVGMVITPTMKFVEDGENKYYFHISKRIFNFEHLEKGSIATVVMTIEEEIFDSICNMEQELSEHSLNFIMTKDRKIVTYPNKDYVSKAIGSGQDVEEFVKGTGYLNNRRTSLNQYEDPSTGWIFCNVYDQDYMLFDVKKSQWIFVFSGCIAIIFAVLGIRYTVKRLNEEVNSVVDGMKEVRDGNLDVKVPVQGKNEIGVMAQNFNLMTEDIKQLIREVEVAKDEQRNAEIRALEAQINPHFLYNTLDSINWMAIEKEEHEISKMLRNLGIILRYSVNKSNSKATVAEMADWLQSYIDLQKLRFDDKFSYEVNIEAGTEKIRMHKLLLQPFVENAIIHGMEDTERGGKLQIEFSLVDQDEYLMIIVEDNGKGMSREMVNEFNDLEIAAKDDGRGIGMHNAFSRMHMYYGNKVKWNLNSMLGMGTVVTIYIPVGDQKL